MALLTDRSVTQARIWKAIGRIVHAFPLIKLAKMIVGATFTQSTVTMVRMNDMTHADHPGVACNGWPGLEKVGLQ